MQEESIWKLSFSDFGYLDPFRRYSRSKFEVVRNRAEFCMFLAPNFFGGRAPKFLDLHYKEHPYCDHVAKFHGDRPRELGGSPANKKKHLQKNIRPPGTNVPGGLIKRQSTRSVGILILSYAKTLPIPLQSKRPLLSDRCVWNARLL